MIKGLARRFLAECLDGLHLQRCLGKREEELRKPGLHRLHPRIDVGEISLACRVVELRARPQMLEKLLERPLEPDLGHDRAHLTMNAGDFGKAEVVDLRRGHVGRGVVGEQRFIISLAVRQSPDAVIGRRDRLLTLHLGE